MQKIFYTYIEVIKACKIARARNSTKEVDFKKKNFTSDV